MRDMQVRNVISPTPAYGQQVVNGQAHGVQTGKLEVYGFSTDVATITPQLKESFARDRQRPGTPTLVILPGVTP